VESVAPFNLVYFNASFARLLSLRTSDQVYGKPFANLLAHETQEDNANNTINLSDFAVSSSNGVHQRVTFQLGPAFEHRDMVECRIKVNPIVDRKKSSGSEVNKVLYFGIEVTAIEGTSQGSFIAETYGGELDSNLAVGVMG
jgi:hypothetical protein